MFFLDFIFKTVPPKKFRLCLFTKIYIKFFYSIYSKTYSNFQEKSMKRITAKPIWEPVKFLFRDKFVLVLENFVFADIFFGAGTHSNMLNTFKHNLNSRFDLLRSVGAFFSRFDKQDTYKL